LFVAAQPGFIYTTQTVFVCLYMIAWLCSWC
jgi:hypothetical protein